MLVSLTSGKHTVTFSMEDDGDVAEAIMTQLQQTYEMTPDATPAMTYLDDEGDTINLNIGVAVEMAEAQRVQLAAGQNRLSFTLVEPLRLRARPSLLEKPKQPEEAELINEDVEDVEAALVEAALAASLEQQNTTPAITEPVVVDDDIAGIMQHVQDTMQGLARTMQGREAALKTQLEDKTVELATLTASCLEAKRTTDELRQQLTEVKTAHEEQGRQDKLALQFFTERNRETVQKKNAVIAKLEETIEQQSNRFENLQGKHAVVLKQTSKHEEEKKALVDAIASKTEEVTNHQLRVADLEAANMALQKQNEALRAKMKSVFEIMQGCMGPAAQAGATLDNVFKKAETFGNSVEAVCVAAKEEVSEAVRGVHNYVKAKAKAPTDSEPVESSLNGGGVKALAKKMKKAAAPKPPVRNPFIAAMDATVVRPRDRDAFLTVRNMGFSEVTVEQVAQLMKKNNDDVSRVIEKILSCNV